MAYANYYVLPYIPNKKRFKIGKTTNVFTKKDAETIIRDYKEKSEAFLRQQQAVQLQNILNGVVNKYESQYEHFISKIVQDINNTNYNLLANTVVDGVAGAAIRRGSIKLNWSHIMNHKKEFETVIDQICSKMNGYQKGEDINTSLSRIEGSLNKIRGDIFEKFLEIIFDHISVNLDEIAEAADGEVVDRIVDAIGKVMTDNRIKVTVQKRKTGKKMGDVIKESIDITVNGNELMIKQGQQKTDVKIGGLTNLGQTLNDVGISAKNYSSGQRQISLLGSANVIGLISSWTVLNSVKLLAANGLSAGDIHTEQFDIIKEIFKIQGLMGTEGESIKSQLLVINRNTKRNPFLVLSVYEMLFNDKYTTLAEMQYTDDIVTFDNARTPDDFNRFVLESKVSIKTQLKLSEMLRQYKGILNSTST